MDPGGTGRGNRQEGPQHRVGHAGEPQHRQYHALDPGEAALPPGRHVLRDVAPPATAEETRAPGQEVVDMGVVARDHVPAR